MRRFLLILLILTSCKLKDDTIHIEVRNGLAFIKETSELYSGTRTEYFKNGKIAFSAPYENGIRNGTTTWFYENGKKKSEGQTIKGEKEGEWKAWFEDGKLSMESTYLN